MGNHTDVQDTIEKEMVFSEALNLLNQGYIVARKSWVDSCHIGKIDEHEKAGIIQESHLYMGKKGAKFVPYVLNNEDLFATDWVMAG